MPHEVITSVQNPRVKDAARLRDRREREQQGCTIVDGAREVRLALQAGVRLVRAFVCSELCRTPESLATVKLLSHDPTAEVWWVTPAVFARLAFGEREEGVLAVVETPLLGLDDLRLPNDALVAVLEGVEKPGNLGAVLRSADGAGIAAVIVADGRTDVYNPNAIRASLGTVFSLSVRAASTDEVLAWLRRNKFRMCAAQLDAALPYTSVDFTGPTAIVLGSEARGLSPAWNAADITGVKLPMLGAADSLNVSATAAVLFYEALRQRSVAATPRSA